MTERAQELSLKGQAYIREAILVVLYDAYGDECGVGAAEISRRAGIFPGPPPDYTMNDGITTNLLHYLENEKKVRRASQPNNRSGWRLSEEEYTSRMNNPDFDSLA